MVHFGYVVHLREHETAIASTTWPQTLLGKSLERRIIARGKLHAKYTPSTTETLLKCSHNISTGVASSDGGMAKLLEILLKPVFSCQSGNFKEVAIRSMLRLRGASPKF